ncbi:MAG TPA: preprotein translocase subunit YajC [Candidatus Cloacimonetes bacterium]|nr:preprotein translocase subunit YajC [Candidatus Cloacimonadota bacterium]
MFTSLLYAQEAAGEAPQAAQGGGIMGFLPIIIMFVILYFLLIRPQQKKQKDMIKMRDELQKNEKVITSGGIIGTIYSIKGDIVVLKVDDNVKIEVTKSAIATKITNQ